MMFLLTNEAISNTAIEDFTIMDLKTTKLGPYIMNPLTKEGFDLEAILIRGHIYDIYYIYIVYIVSTQFRRNKIQ